MFLISHRIIWKFLHVTLFLKNMRNQIFPWDYKFNQSNLLKDILWISKISNVTRRTSIDDRVTLWLHWRHRGRSGIWLQNCVLQLPMAFLEPTRPKQYPNGSGCRLLSVCTASQLSQHGKDLRLVGHLLDSTFPWLSFLSFEFRVCIASAWLNCMLLFEFTCACCFVNAQAEPLRGWSLGVDKVAGCSPGFF